MFKVYIGHRDARGDHVVTAVDGNSFERLAFSAEPSKAVRNHSPDGFSWGYSGSGPAQLALALVLDCTGDPEMAQSFYQEFKRDVVAGLPDDWAMTYTQVLAWVQNRAAVMSVRHETDGKTGGGPVG